MTRRSDQVRLASGPAAGVFDLAGVYLGATGAPRKRSVAALAYKGEKGGAYGRYLSERRGRPTTVVS